MANHDQTKLRPDVQQHVWPFFVLITSISITLNLFLHNNVRTALLNEYPGDSFHTLSSSAALGLAFITSTLLVLVLLLAWHCTKRCINRSAQASVGCRLATFIVSLVGIVVAYYLMLLLVPQIYYAYYQWVFTGLPTQSVIKPLSPNYLLKLVSLPPGASMADHLAGFVLWVLIFNTGIQWGSNTFFKSTKP